VVGLVDAGRRGATAGRGVRPEDVVGDREDVEAGAAVEVDQLVERQLTVAPGGVRMQFAEKWSHLRPHLEVECCESRRMLGKRVVTDL
jgi:hypothetical protein